MNNVVNLDSKRPQKSFMDTPIWDIPAMIRRMRYCQAASAALAALVLFLEARDRRV